MGTADRRGTAETTFVLKECHQTPASNLFLRKGEEIHLDSNHLKATATVPE